MSLMDPEEQEELGTRSRPLAGAELQGGQGGAAASPAKSFALNSLPVFNYFFVSLTVLITATHIFPVIIVLHEHFFRMN